MPPEDEDVTATRLVLSQKISAYLDVVQGWKEEYNAYADTSKFPPEILALIFLSVAEMVHDNADPPRDMLRITHVCHHWRMVAILNQDFWSYVPLQARRKSRVPNPFLARAGDKPLKVSLSVGELDDTFAVAMQDIRDIIPRTTSLVVYFNNSSDPDCVEEGLECFSWPARNLRSLILKSAVRYSSYAIGYDFFGRVLPCLQRLSLDWGIPFDWDDACFVPTLTHVDLSMYNAPTFPDVIEAIRGLPLLQAFSHKHRGTDFPEAASDIPPHHSDAPVRMDHLQKFRLVAHPHIVAGLCLSLVFPPNAEITLVCDDGLRWSEGRFTRSLRPLLSWVAAHYVNPPSLYTSFLRIKRLSSTRFCSHLIVESGYQCATKDTHWAQLSNPTVRLEISVYFTDDYPEYWSDMIPKVTTTLSSIRIETMHLDYMPDITNWVDILSQFAGVRSIRLSGPFAFAVLEQLTQPQYTDESETVQDVTPPPLPPPLSSLHTIIFSGVQTMDSAALTGFLRWRIVKGHPIQQVWLRRCHMDPILVREIRQLGLVLEGMVG